MLNPTTVIKIRHLNENSFPSAERIVALPSDRGIAPSRTPCGQIYLTDEILNLLKEIVGEEKVSL